MKVLLDTHVIIWWLEASDRLSADLHDIIGDRRNRIWLSLASVWEMAIKSSLGKLRTPGDLPQQLDSNDIRPLPITMDHVLGVATLPFHHGDPFDRMLIAQARTENLILITHDARISAYDVRTLKV